MPETIFTETIRLEGGVCRIAGTGTGGPVIYWGVGTDSRTEPEQVSRQVMAENPGRPFCLAAYEVSDWNAFFSPWPAPPVFGKEGFAGNAEETLRWLTQVCMPALEGSGRISPSERLLAGYSLAGLFSLWAFYRSGRFAGTACCSGSLWYPGWQAFMQDRHAPLGSRIYLSLGEKEERTKNAAMARVGDATREQYRRICGDAAVVRHRLEWNPGGHFHRPTDRMVRGISWLLQA